MEPSTMKATGTLRVIISHSETKMSLLLALQH